MNVKKDGKIYTVTESRDKWAVKAESGKLAVTYDISKNVCPTVDELRVYIQEKNMF